MIKSNISFHDIYTSHDNDYNEIIHGLIESKQKTLSPKYFYDENGSSLFDKITTLDDYYPTKKEIEILENHNEEFYNILPANSSVIEFGSGSNKKIKKFLNALDKPTEYIPIDISRDFLFKNAQDSAKNFPNLRIKAVCADFNQINDIEEIIATKNSKIGFFPGSTIGNYTPESAISLLEKFAKILGEDNFLIVGVDLKKNIEILEKAYNDSEGITAKFNKNILNGINKISGAIFKEENFSHRAFFNKKKSRIEMHLVSKKNQTVKIFKETVSFTEGETIHTENSYKYSVENFKKLAESASYELIKVLTDKSSFFGIFFLKVKSF